MKNNFSQSTKTPSSRPILIVDKKGIIGKILASKLSEHFVVVLVTGRSVDATQNIIHIPFLKRIPKIPDNFYSYIFLIDDGDVLSKSMPSFIKKANADQSRIVLIESLRNPNHKSVDETRFYKNANVFFYGDLFSQKQTLSDVGDELSEIKQNKKIKIAGDGLEKLYPIYIDDFIEVLIEQVFVKNNSAKFINVFPKAPITSLGLSRIIQSIDPQITLDFKKTNEIKKDPKVEDGDFVIDDYDLRTKLKSILEEEIPSDFEKNDSLSEEISEKSYLRVALGFVVLFIVFFLLLPLFTTVFYSGLGLYEIDNLKKNLEKGDLSSAYKSANDSKTFFQFASKTIVPLKSEAKIIGKGSSVDKFSSKIILGEEVSQASVDLISGAKKIQTVVKGESQNPSDDFSSSMSLMKDSIDSFRKIEAQSSDFPSISGKIMDVAPVVDLISNFSNILPKTLGFGREMKYLVLFQNNMELRPGGGFIGSYATLTLKNYTVESFKIYNVYDADGQLKGHIEPPFPIRKYLGQKDLFLRDSNFDPQFINNASEAAYLLNLETGEKIDGIIAVDINFVKEIISAIGPISISDYNLIVNKDNLFQITEEQAQKNSFAGSTQKQDFLSALFKSIQTKIGIQKNLPYLSLAKAISNSLLEKHILMASDDPSVQSNLSVNNWSSQFPNSASSKSDTFDDFLGISEANLGINKVNYFISKTISKAQMIDDAGALSSTVTVSYKNQSSDQNYKNYIRFILPNSISVSQISFDDVAQNIIAPQSDPNIYEANSYKSPSGLEVDNYIEDGKTIVGFLVNIPPKSSKTIAITYDLNQVLNLGTQFNYNFHYFKQPGTGPTPFDLSIYYPKSYSPVTEEKDLQVEASKLTLDKTLDSDSQFNFSFGQK